MDIYTLHLPEINFVTYHDAAKSMDVIVHLITTLVPLKYFFTSKLLAWLAFVHSTSAPIKF